MGFTRARAAPYVQRKKKRNSAKRGKRVLPRRKITELPGKLKGEEEQAALEQAPGKGCSFEREDLCIFSSKRTIPLQNGREGSKQPCIVTFLPEGEKARKKRKTDIFLFKTRAKGKKRRGEKTNSLPLARVGGGKGDNELGDGEEPEVPDLRGGPQKFARGGESRPSRTVIRVSVKRENTVYRNKARLKYISLLRQGPRGGGNLSQSPQLRKSHIVKEQLTFIVGSLLREKKEMIEGRV